ncbi:MAG: hypothetical protein M0036_12685 [Desulfobacteraceae bacterium]|nr:hypothetical protein [Desulfobacteraceae bacterium]
MALILGSVLITLSVLLFCVVMLAFRNPQQPFWASDAWVGNFHSILIIAFGLAGILTIGFTLMNPATDSFNKMDITIAAAILAGMVIGVKMMGIKKRLAQFQKQA